MILKIFNNIILILMNLFGDFDTKKKPSLFTYWSFIHLLAGIVLMYIFYIYFNIQIFLSIFIVLFIHTLWEIKDLYINPLLYKNNSNLHYSNSFLNSIGDTIACIIGILIVIFFIKDKNNIFFISVFILWIVISRIFKIFNIH